MQPQVASCQWELGHGADAYWAADDPNFSFLSGCLPARAVSFLADTVEAPKHQCRNFLSPLCVLPCEFFASPWPTESSGIGILPTTSFVIPSWFGGIHRFDKELLCLHSSIHKICFNRREPRTKPYLRPLESSRSDKLNRNELISKLWAWFSKWLQVHLPHCISPSLEFFMLPKRVS